MADLFGLIGPLSINLILNYVNETQTINNNVTYAQPEEVVNNKNNLEMILLPTSKFISNGYIIAIGVLMATFLQSTLSSNFNHLANAEGIHLRTALQV